MDSQTIGLVVHSVGRTGVLHQLTGVIARHEGDITSVEILGNYPPEARTYFEVVLPGPPAALVTDLRALEIVRTVDAVKTLQTIYGKRIIIMGGGAQVGQVALGAIVEADRHNIRGEHISVDTIPLVGEQQLADAVRAVPRLSRVRALVLAGSLIGLACGGAKAFEFRLIGDDIGQGMAIVVHADLLKQRRLLRHRHLIPERVELLGQCRDL